MSLNRPKEEKAAPDLTVVIPAWKEAQRLPRILSDVRNQNRQTAVVVVDNNSQDSTRAVAESYVGDQADQLPHLQVIEMPRQGVAYARNAGAELVKTKYILFADADTRLHETSFQAIVDEMNMRSLAAAGCFVEPDSKAFLDLAITGTLNQIMNVLQFDAPTCMGAAVVSTKEAHDAIGGFHQMDIYEDVDYVRRIAESGRTYRMLDQRGTSATFCMRRFRNKGYFRQIWQYGKNGIVYLSSGIVPKDIDYVMGGGQDDGL